MEDKDNVNSFVNEYEQLCIKHNLCICRDRFDNLDVFRLSLNFSDFTSDLLNWRIKDET
jgi:hypothetical protein